MDSVLILSTNINETTVEEVVKILQKKASKTVAVCNTNTLVRSYRNPTLQKKINSFDIRVPDGFPVAKASNLLYKNNQKRVDGYKLFLKTLEFGLSNNTSHYFYGNNEFVTKKMIKEIKKLYPSVNIAGYFCPPVLNYDQLTQKEYLSDLIVRKPDIVWVSLGFPKQEQFINLFNKNYNIKSNMVGVGAVFEWMAGTKYKAPEWLANIGFEWIFRLFQEPKRLLRRYLVDNFFFIIYFIKQYLTK